MKLTQINQDTSGETGFLDFDVTGAGSIRRATVSTTIAKGDFFNVYYGDGGYTPHRKTAAKWLGSGKSQKSVQEVLQASLEKSEVYLGERMDSEAFYRKVAAKFCACKCKDPVISKNHPRKLVGVDLEYPNIGRQSSRFIVLQGNCQVCGESLTFGTGFGSFHTTGLKELTKLAQTEALRMNVVFSLEGVATRLADLKQPKGSVEHA